MKVAAEGIRIAGSTDPKAIRDAIAGLELKVSTGTIKFNKLGEVMKAVQVQVVKDGNWHHYAVIDDAELLTPPSE